MKTKYERDQVEARSSQVKYICMRGLANTKCKHDGVFALCRDLINFLSIKKKNMMEYYLFIFWVNHDGVFGCVQASN